MNTAYLLLGANLGDKKMNLEAAKHLVSAVCGRITSASSLYETEAWGNEGQPSFLNQALCIQTELSARQLLLRILRTEKKMGRIRQQKYDPRIIDIDILLFNDEIQNSAFLSVPHPEMQNRKFALMPLAEIAPAVVHPVLKKTIAVLLSECPDPLNAKKYS
jgi:2-amino-4-hydroxy-6-hydroxymethyldihydropteridine diphosphokinase